MNDRAILSILSERSTYVFDQETGRLYSGIRAESIGKLANLGHRIVSTFNNRLKPCVICAMSNTRSKYGLRVRIRHKCEKCGVALCIGKRNCFSIYHESLL